MPPTNRIEIKRLAPNGVMVCRTITDGQRRRAALAMGVVFAVVCLVPVGSWAVFGRAFGGREAAVVAAFLACSVVYGLGRPFLPGVRS